MIASIIFGIIDTIILLFILKKQIKMSAEFEQAKADLLEIKGIVVRVGEDVTTLQTTIDNLSEQGEGATPEQVAELQALISGIKTSLQTIDDKTANPTPELS